MGTVSKIIADAIQRGEYDDDQPTKIVTYNNMFNGELTYAVVFKHDRDQNKYENAPTCDNVKVIWTNTNLI